MDSGLCHPRDSEVGCLLQQEEKAAEGAENGGGDEDLLMRLSVQAVTNTLHHIICRLSIDWCTGIITAVDAVDHS